MAQKTTYTCDVCGRRKGEANHWWLVIINDDNALEPEILAPEMWSFAVVPWTAIGRMKLTAALDLCGVGCVHKRLAQFETAHQRRTETERKEAAGGQNPDNG
ncbi:MAG: hypothetical protein KGL39_54565 [Patescibacteria group bacterium]|nr:hypothetical protein [Patescibacteria group bacterium]